ncbi:MAG: hypothetical protein IJQ80_08065, partial [Clostridia bacterium]|nr:hypothetical protein [Clostridia bacterium]
MKKLLSFVIVAMMIVSCIVPAFALTTAPTAEAGVENTLSIWVEDAEYDETAQTLTVYLNVANNEDGFEYLKVYVFYPECLTLSSTKGAGFAPTKEITAGIENSGWTKNLKDALDTMGTPVPAGADYQDYYPGLKYTSPCIDRVGETDEGEDDDCFDNGRWCALTFTYDESKNTVGTQLPITLVNSPDDQMHVYRDGYEWSDEMIDVVVYDGIATVPAGEQPPVCEHANTHDEIITPATCTETGLKNVVCDD